MSEYKNVLNKGTRNQVPQTADNRDYGSAIEVKPSEDWKPEVLPADTYKPAQEKDPAGMHALMQGILDQRKTVEK
jgi:hypothetical protein